MCDLSLDLIANSKSKLLIQWPTMNEYQMIANGQQNMSRLI